VSATAAISAFASGAESASERRVSLRDATHPGDVERATGALKELGELSSRCGRWLGSEDQALVGPFSGCVEDDVFQLSQSLDLVASSREVV
jgi:hypothetical protein